MTQTTNDTTPTITGTFDDSDSTLTSVQVDGVTYTVGTDLTVSGGAWSLTIPAGNEITPDGTYQVVVTATDSVGNASVDASTNELVIDTTGPNGADGCDADDE